MSSELAFNLNGEPFDVPPHAAGWRVRKMKHKGAPEVVYGRNGMPLILPIEADLDDVRQETTAPGRYRLDPVDEANRPIPEAPVGYVYVHDQTHAPHAPATTTALLRSASDNVVIEAMRMNAEIAKSVVDRFPQMLEAASTLLRAADGAGLPARMPRPAEVTDEGVDQDDDEDEPEAARAAPAGFDLNAIVAQLVPMIVTSLMSGKLKLPGLGEMFDWRKAGDRAKAHPTAKRRTEPPTEVNPAGVTAEDAANDDAVTPGVDPRLPPIDPATLVHFVAIQQALKPDEAALARAVAADLGPAELRAWFEDLKKLGVPDAVAKIRAIIGKQAAS